MVDYLLSRIGRMATGDVGGLTATYHCALEGPGGGPVTLALTDGQATATRGAPPAADVTLTSPPRPGCAWSGAASTSTALSPAARPAPAATR